MVATRSQRRMGLPMESPTEHEWYSCTLRRLERHTTTSLDAEPTILRFPPSPPPFSFLVSNGKARSLNLSKLLSFVFISFQINNIHLGANILPLPFCFSLFGRLYLSARKKNFIFIFFILFFLQSCKLFRLSEYCFSHFDIL